MSVLAPKDVYGLKLTSVHAEHISCGAVHEDLSAFYHSSGGTSVQILEGSPYYCGNIGAERLVRHVTIEGHRANLLACGTPHCTGPPDALVWEEDHDGMQVIWTKIATGTAIGLARSLSVVPRTGARAALLRAAVSATAMAKLPTQLLRKRGLEVRPPVVSFTGDGTGYLGGFTGSRSVGVARRAREGEDMPWAGRLKWSRWTPSQATASGAVWLNNGIPDDASGTFHPYAVTVHASRPIGGVFTRLSFRFRYHGQNLTEERVAVRRPANSSFSGWEWDIPPRGASARIRSAATDESVASSTSSSVVAEDETTVSNLYGNCRAFAGPAGCSELFKVAKTSDGHGGVLYGVLLTNTAGGGCRGGAAYFFDGRRLVATTEQAHSVRVAVSRLPPHPQYGTESGAISVPHASEFAVGYLVDRAKFTSCATSGNGGRDTYIYRWTGKTLTIVSGRPPTPPAVFSP